MATSDSGSLEFLPPDLEWHQTKARMLGVELKLAKAIIAPYPRRIFKNHTPPITWKTVSGGGNCFFHSLSFWVTGSEEFHVQMRAAVVNEMRTHPLWYKRLAPNMNTYLNESRIYEPGQWATHVEITAAATLLQTPIYVFAPFGPSDLWQVHRPVRYFEQRTPYMVYLRNKDYHFEPVTLV